MRASEQFVERYYTDDLAEQESPESMWAAQWAKEVRGSSVLNAACGPQLFNDALAFAETPRHLVGIDANATNIEFLKESELPDILNAKKFLAEHDVNVHLLLNDVREHNPALRKRFDAAYVSGLIGSFDEADRRATVRMLSAYLKPGGRLVIVTWAEDYLNKAKLEERRRYHWYERRDFSPADILKLLRVEGFEVLKHDAYRPNKPREYEWGLIYGIVANKPT
jgi:SAM-dependent methyltransferase